MNIYRSDEFFEDGQLLYLSPVLSSVHEEDTHMHEFLELVYICSGSGEHSIDGQVFHVSRGDLLFINLGQTHAILSGGMQYINCLLKPAFISGALSDSDDWAAFFSLSLFDSYDQDFDHKRCVIRFQGEERLEVQSLFAFMMQEREKAETNHTFVLSAYMQIVLAKMLRALKKEQRSADSHKLDMEIIDYVNQNCYGTLSLTTLAEKYFYNPAYLSTKFKEISGKSLSVYIRERRMQEAERLLADTGLSVEAIYTAVGYTEKGHFYSAFKKHTGMTPLQFRKQRQQT